MKFKKSEVLDITGFYGLLLRCMKIREIGRSPTIPSFMVLVLLYIFHKCEIYFLICCFKATCLL